MILIEGNKCQRYWQKVLNSDPVLKAFKKNETNRKALDVAKEQSGDLVEESLLAKWRRTTLYRKLQIVTPAPRTQPLPYIYACRSY